MKKTILMVIMLLTCVSVFACHFEKGYILERFDDDGSISTIKIQGGSKLYVVEYNGVIYGYENNEKITFDVLIDTTTEKEIIITDFSE